MNILEEFYKTLKPGRQGERVHKPHSSVYYVCAAVKQATGVEVHPYDMEKLIYEEGLLPVKEYKIPLWYRRKYKVS